MSLGDIAAQMELIDTEIEIMNLFRQYNSIALNIRAIGRSAILIFNKRPTKEQERTKIQQFASFSDAVRKLEKLEEANIAGGDPYDIVLVRSVGSQQTGSIQSAFRNYFADTREFVGYVDQALKVARSG